MVEASGCIGGGGNSGLLMISHGQGVAMKIGTVVQLAAHRVGHGSKCKRSGRIKSWWMIKEDGERHVSNGGKSCTGGSERITE